MAPARFVPIVLYHFRTDRDNRGKGSNDASSGKRILCHGGGGSAGHGVHGGYGLVRCGGVEACPVDKEKIGRRTEAITYRLAVACCKQSEVRQNPGSGDWKMSCWPLNVIRVIDSSLRFQVFPQGILASVQNDGEREIVIQGVIKGSVAVVRGAVKRYTKR